MFFKPASRLVLIRYLGILGWNSAPKQDDTEKIKQHAEQHPEKRNNFEKLYYETAANSDRILDHAVDQSRNKISHFMIEKGIPGLAICVAKKGEIIWHTAFGLCDVENQLPCNRDARMRIASISKPMFVATVVAPMIEEGKIDIDSSIHKYLSPDEFPKKKFNDQDIDITVKQLMSHTSGLRHYEEDRAEEKPFRSIGSPGSQTVCQCDSQFDRREFYQRTTYRSVKEALKPFKEDPLVGEPGKYNYTTYGYTLLSAVVEQAHQQAATNDKVKEEQIEDHWLKVLRREWKLDETSLDQDELLLPNRARYYLRTAYNGGLINAPYADSSVKWAGGGLVSTTKDLVKFGNALVDSYKSRESSKLKRETLDLLWNQVEQSYGLGFAIKTLDPKISAGEVRAVYHLGNAVGCSSALIMYPDSEIVVAILTNLGSTNLMSAGLYVADQFANSNQRQDVKDEVL